MILMVGRQAHVASMQDLGNAGHSVCKHKAAGGPNPTDVDWSDEAAVNKATLKQLKAFCDWKCLNTHVHNSLCALDQ